MSNIIQKNLLNQYKEDTTAYAIYISRMRSIPSVKDGLKPIHRRILYTAYKHCPSTSFSKSSSIVGKCMDMFHPHGDTSIYDSMKPLTNWFEINIPLIENQGNFGNFQGGRASAMRYTEAKISKFALENVVGELRENDNIVDWSPTYNNRMVEPEFLPVTVPLLLINGIFGIALGLTSRIPKHNINEVIDATINLIRNPESDVVLIPEQGMPCDIIETNFKQISNTGSGKYRVRGRMEIEDVKVGNKMVKAIAIKSLPDLTYLDSILEKINEFVEKKKLFDIVDVVDRSTETEMNCLLILKSGSDANYVKDFLYKNTSLEHTFNVSFEVIDGTDIFRLSYKAYLEYFIKFRKITKFRYYNNKLQDIQTKIHEKEAFIKLLSSNKLNKIIDMIRNQNTMDDSILIEYLVNNLKITDLQASYIINANIKKLSGVYLDKYKNEASNYHNMSEQYIAKIMNDDLLLEEIVSELKDVKKKYGKPRICRIISKSEASSVPKGDFKIIITENNFIKKVPSNSTIGSFKGDTPKIVIDIPNDHNLLIFDSIGRVCKIPVHKITVSDKSSNGIDIRKINSKISNIVSICSEEDLKALSKSLDKQFLVVLTHNGLIKKLDLDDFTTVPPSGIVYNKLEQGDYVKGVMVAGHTNDVIVYSKNKASRININDIPYNKRNTKGSKSMSSEYVDGMDIIRIDTTDALVVTEAGRVNKIGIPALPITGRNKAGSKVIRLDSGDTINCIKCVNSNNTQLIVTTKENKHAFDIVNMKSGTSASAGNRLFASKIDNIINVTIS